MPYGITIPGDSEELFSSTYTSKSKFGVFVGHFIYKDNNSISLQKQKNANLIQNIKQKKTFSIIITRTFV